MNIDFEYKNIHYKIHFNGRNILELRGDDIDLLEFCSRLEGKKMSKFLNKYEIERLGSICVVSDFQTSDEDFREFIYESFRGEAIFEKYRSFVIENANAFLTDELVDIIRSHPNHYWVLCGFELPYSLVSSNDICELRSDSDLSHFWNVFTPEEPPTYRDYMFNNQGNDFYLSLGNHNAILIRGDAGCGKSLMYAAMKETADSVQSWLVWHDDYEGYSFGSAEPMYAEVFAMDYDDFYCKRGQYNMVALIKKYKTFIIDHADLIVDEEIAEIIKSHPEKNWILIGNYQPDFIPDDAVCVLKKSGNRYWNEFVSETINKEV